MKVLLDTHSLLWMALGDMKLSVPARTTLEDTETVGLVSPVSYWEVAIKIGLGKYRLHRPFVDFFHDAMACNCFQLLPIELAHADVVSQLPLHHRDPFDRMLIAQAIAEDVPIVSGDAAFDAYPIRRIW